MINAETFTTMNITEMVSALFNSTDDQAYSSNLSNIAPTPLNLSSPTHYNWTYKLAGFSLVTTIFIVGLLGNLMVVFVVRRTRNMRTTTNCYLVSLAIADILLLVSAPLPTIIEYFLIVDQSAFAVLGVGGCSVMVFCQFLGVNVSSLSITAFTVERHIAICHPMRAHTMCTVSRAKKIIAALWLFGVLYCTPWLFLTTTRTSLYADGTTTRSCDFKLKRSYYLTYFLADLVIFYAIPLLLTCVLYGLIAARLYQGSVLVATAVQRPESSATGSSVASCVENGRKRTASGAAIVQLSTPMRSGDSQASRCTGSSSSQLVNNTATSSRIQVPYAIRRR